MWRGEAHAGLTAIEFDLQMERPQVERRYLQLCSMRLVLHHPSHPLSQVFFPIGRSNGQGHIRRLYRLCSIGRRCRTSRLRGCERSYIA